LQFDVVAAQAKEARIETIFRYANVYPKAVALLASGKVDLKPLISASFSFDQSVAAFERAAEGTSGRHQAADRGRGVRRVSDGRSREIPGC
jgi:D-xylulose reductase